MLSTTESVKEVFGAVGKRLAVLWHIERTDGQDFYFTNHDIPVPYLGNTYLPAGGADASARRAAHALKESSVEFRGGISSSLITVDDLRAGRYRQAKITETIVDWRYPYQGAIATVVYWVDETNNDGEVWIAECTGPERFTKRKIGETFDRTCERDLYDSLCTVVQASFTVNNVRVLGMEDGNRNLVIFADPATLGAFSDGYFDYGSLTFTGGANNGISQNVKLYRAFDRRIEMQGPVPFPVETFGIDGTEFSISAGCDKLSVTCATKFSNLINYGGFLFIPGTDRILVTPSFK